MDQDTLLGQVIDDSYELTAIIGSGASSTVYEAVQLSMQRTVAIKIMHVHLTGKDETVARFQREGQLTSSLNHPNIAQVFASGVTERRQPYLVIERLYGRTLSERLCDGPLSAHEFQVVATALGAALNYAHEQGVVHRDIKPSNIIVADNFTAVKLLDFGIAKILGEFDQRLTATGALVGSLAYMSPEQLKAQAVDQRSDIFSLGRVLKECWTGQKDLSLEKRSKAAPSSGKNLMDVLDRFTATNPDERYQSVPEGLRELEEALSKASRSRRHQGSRPRAIGVIAASMVLFAVALATILLRADMLSDYLSSQRLYQLSIPLRQIRLKMVPKSNPEQNIIYGKLYTDMAMDYQDSGNFEDAAAYRKRAIDELVYGIETDPDKADPSKLKLQLDRINPTLMKVLKVKGAGEYALSYLRDDYIVVATDEGQHERYESQLKYFLVRLAIEEQFPSQYVSLAEGYWDAAGSYNTLHDLPSAIIYIDKAIETFAKDPNARYMLAESNCRKALYLQNMNKADQARALLQNCLDSNRFRSDPLAVGRLWRGMADYHHCQRQWQEAVDDMKRAISFFRSASHTWFVADSMREIAEIYMAAGKFAVALPYAEQARRGMIESGNFTDLEVMSNHHDLAICLLKTGRIKESGAMHNQLVKFPTSTLSAARAKQNLLANYKKLAGNSD